MPFFLFLICFLILPLQAFAQSDEVFDATREIITTDEYKSVPRGMLLTEEQRQKMIEEEKAKTGKQDETSVMADKMMQGGAPAVETAPEEKTAAEEAEEIKTAAEESVLTFESVLPLYRAGKFDEALPKLQELLAKQSHGAEELLGIMYRMGQGVEKDSTRAFQLLTAAAESGRPLAAHHLGTMYFAGEGMTADPARSLMWLDAAILFYPDGPEKKQAGQDRDNVFIQLTGEQQAEAKRLLREWLNRIGQSHLLIDLQ